MERRLVVAEITIGVGLWIDSDHDDDALEKAAERFGNIKPYETVGDTIAFQEVSTGRGVREENGLSLSVIDFIDTRNLSVEDVQDADG